MKDRSRLVFALVCGFGWPFAALSDEAPRCAFIDLQPYGNQRLDDQFGSFEDNNLADVPRGEQTLEGTRFKIGEKMINLRGENNQDLPQKVEGIEVDATVGRFHVLHSTQDGEGRGKLEDGTEIGAYIVHYADGTSDRQPILYGEDLRDWWDWPPRTRPKTAKIAWTGTNPAAAMYDRKIRLFSATWANPHPERKVASIDFESTVTECSPFLVALTVETK